MSAFENGEFAPTRGQQEFVFQAPAAATLIDIGDLVYQDPATRKPKSASAMADQGSESANQAAFQQNFLGVSEQRSREDDTDRIRISTRGVKLFDCVAATYRIGDMLGVDEQSGGTALEDRKLVKVTDSSYAIARVHRDTEDNATKVWAQFESTVMFGGIQLPTEGSSSGNFAV
jgi:hypothetical protein